jgi:hypothetical protein
MTCVVIPRFIGSVPVDVVLEEDHRSDLTITENPIEFGADVADHAYVEPKRLKMRGAVGATPRIGSIVHGFPSTRVSAAYEALLALQKQKEPFDVVTGLTLYRNMLIESIGVKRDVKTAGILDFEAELTEVIIATSAYAEGSGDKTPAAGETAQRASGNVNRGEITPTPQATTSSTISGANNGSALSNVLGVGSR